MSDCCFYSFTEMTKRDVPGFAIGGLSGGEEKSSFWRMVNVSTDLLPRNKPRYLMGVGYVPFKLLLYYITVLFQYIWNVLVNQVLPKQMCSPKIDGNWRDRLYI